MRKLLLILLALTVIGFLAWYGYHVVMFKLEYRKYQKVRAEQNEKLKRMRDEPLI
jgi:hypothetical protein